MSIGHPLGGPRTVHDNTFVYFPFRVTAEQLDRARNPGALRIPHLRGREDQSRTRRQAQGVQGQLPDVNEPAGDHYENYSRRFAHQPTIGRGLRHLPRQLGLASLQPPHASRRRTALRRPGRSRPAVAARLARPRSHTSNRVDRVANQVRIARVECRGERGLSHPLTHGEQAHVTDNRMVRKRDADARRLRRVRDNGQSVSEAA